MKGLFICAKGWTIVFVWTLWQTPQKQQHVDQAGIFPGDTDNLLSILSWNNPWRAAPCSCLQWKLFETPQSNVDTVLLRWFTTLILALDSELITCCRICCVHKNWKAELSLINRQTCGDLVVAHYAKSSEAGGKGQRRQEALLWDLSVRPH